MASKAEHGGGWRRNRWRTAAWATAALVLLAPLAAMQFTDEVAWDLADFMLVGAMLLGAGLAYELAARMPSAYRRAVGVALATTFLLIWMSLAVGVIGSEDNPANLMYGAVLAVGVIGAAISRFRAGMARALIATALAQALVGGVAALNGFGSVLVLTAGFVALWLGSAWLFRKAARDEAAAA